MNSCPVEIRLLGKFEILTHGRQVTVPRAKKARLLLGYLILRDSQPTDRGQIAAMLWPDSDDAAARFNLRQMLQSVRRDLGELGSRLISDGADTLAFDVSDCWVDYFEFKRAVANSPREAV